MNVEAIWAFARERHHIYLRRAADLPPPWTDDPILQRYRFCNIYRELDRTTQWCAKHVRNRSSTDVLLAITVFRWFNRISTGEALFCQPDLFDNKTAFDRFAETGATIHLKNALPPTGPYVTGSYVIKTPDGYSKLDGVLKCLDWFFWETRNGIGWRNPPRQTLSYMYQWLALFPYLGSFMAAQIVADVKYTDLLKDAPDWDTFVAPGPGSTRGLNIVMGREPTTKIPYKQFVDEILELRRRLFPYFQAEGWEVPHAQDHNNICCEYAKYVRGSSRQIFRR